MRFISQAPQLIGKGCHGVWRVKAEYSNGVVNEQNYIANTSAEAKRLYLREHGNVRGQLSAEFIQKISW